MPGITKQQAQAKLDEWLAADTKVAEAQAMSKSGRSYTGPDAKTVNENIAYWNKQVKRLSRGGIRVTGATPRG